MFTPKLDDAPFSYGVGKAVCVGRNYAAHAAELNNPIPEQPLLFIKPADAVVPLQDTVEIPSDQGAVHYELEIALLIGERISKATPEQALAAVAGVGVALDLTLREVQSGLKAKAHPWERAKAFDGSCPVSDFVAASRVQNWADLGLSLDINEQSRQDGNSANMLFPIPQLLAEMSHCFSLNPGDIVLTGTPEGVGQLQDGDRLKACLNRDWVVSQATVKTL